MATADDRQHLSAIRRRIKDASTQWQVGPTGTELHAVFMTNTPPVSMAMLTTDCGIPDRDFLAHAHDDITFLLRLLDTAFSEVRRWKPSAKQREQRAHENGDYAAECAMRCKDQLFRRFLAEDKKQDVSDDVRVDSAVRYLLKVDSRGELNNDAGARKRWFDLRGEFENWSRTA